MRLTAYIMTVLLALVVVPAAASGFPYDEPVVQARDLLGRPAEFEGKIVSAVGVLLQYEPEHSALFCVGDCSQIVDSHAYPKPIPGISLVTEDDSVDTNRLSGKFVQVSGIFRTSPKGFEFGGQLERCKVKEAHKLTNMDYSVVERVKSLPIPINPSELQHLQNLYSGLLKTDGQLAGLGNPPEIGDLLISLDDVMQLHMHHMRQSASVGVALALTEPSLEPSYPVIGSAIPIYRLPVQPKLGSAILSDRPFRDIHRRLTDRELATVRFLFGRKVRDVRNVYLAYKTCFANRSWANSQMPNDDLQREWRQRLVTLVGPEAVDQLDKKLAKDFDSKATK